MKNYKTWTWWLCLNLISNWHFYNFLKLNLYILPSINYLDFNQKMSILYSGIYLVQIYWRSIFPSDYVNNTVFFNSILNSVLFERLLASVGETAFIMQINYWLKLNPYIKLTNIVIVIFAQFFATTATITKNLIFFIYEALLWTFLFLIMIIFSPFKTLPILAVGFMIFYYIPYCFKTWQNSCKNKKINIKHKLKRYCSRDWNDWKCDALWITPYFLFGGYASLYIVRDIIHIK